MHINQITDRIIASAIEVHRALGPGPLESAYTRCLGFEFQERGLSFDREIWLPLRYKSHEIRYAYRMDFVVEKQVVVEIKTIQKLTDLDSAQVLTYLKLSGHKVGLILNFKVPILTQGIRRLVMNLPEDSATPRLCGELP